MIKKYKQFNEGVLDKLNGPSREEGWKHFGYDKSFNTPEEFFIDAIDGMTIKSQTDFPDSVLWVKNGKILFELDPKSKYVYVDCKLVWNVIETIFGMSFSETQLFIKNMMEKHLNWKGYRYPREVFHDQ